MSMDRIPTSRAALILVEFQGEWLDADAPLRRNLVEDQTAFDAAIATAADLVQVARRHHFPIVHAGLDLRGDPRYALFGGGAGKAGLAGAIPQAGTWTGERTAFREPFVPGRGEFASIGRSGGSVLKHSTLDPYLRHNDIRTLFFCGFATHVCVESSLREAHDMGLDGWIVADACAAFSRAQHDHVIEHVVHHFGRATDARQLCDAIAER